MASTMLGPRAASAWHPANTFDGTNWVGFLRAFESACYSMDTLPCIQGKRPTGNSEADEKARVAWDGANKRIQPLLSAAIQPTILAVAPSATDAHAILTWIAATYAPSSAESRAMLLQELLAIRQGDGDVAAYETAHTAAHARCVAAGLVIEQSTLAYVVHGGAKRELAERVQLGLDSAAVVSSDDDIDFAPRQPDMLGNRAARLADALAKLKTSPRAPELTPSLMFQRLRFQERLIASQETTASGNWSRGDKPGGKRADERDRDRQRGDGDRSVKSRGPRDDDEQLLYICNRCKGLAKHPTSRHRPHYRALQLESLLGGASRQPKSSGGSSSGATGKAAVGGEDDVHLDASVSQCFCKTPDCSATSHAAAAASSAAKPNPDSGATEHMHGDRGAFDPATYRRFDRPHSVKLANGSRIPAEGLGDVTYVGRVNGQPRTILLERTWHVPAIREHQSPRRRRLHDVVPARGHVHRPRRRRRRCRPCSL
jgi:hypothetical protein